jgi:hypothetical protein
MTEEELLRDLLESQAGDEGKTIAELCEALDVDSIETMRGVVKVAIAQGRMVVGKGVRQGMDLRRAKVPVYRVVG